MIQKMFAFAAVCGLMIVQAQTVLITGHVTKNGGGAISGATANLILRPPMVATTNVSGDFSLGGTGTFLRPNPLSQNAPRLNLSGRSVTISLHSKVVQGSLDFFSAGGKKSASLPLVNLAAGNHRIALPELGTGIHFLRVRFDQSPFDYKLVQAEGGSMALSGGTESVSARDALAKQAAVVDTLLVLKAGYRIKKIPMESLNQLNMQIVLDSITDCPAVPAMPAISALTSIPELPDPFKKMNGTRVTSQDDWRCRREEIKAMIQHYHYGPYPAAPTSVTGSYTGTTLTVTVVANGNTISFNSTVTLPSGAGPFPAIIFLSASGSLNAATLNARGLAHITVPTGEIAADARPPRTGKLYTLYGANSGTGALMAWAWAAHRIMDVLPTAIPQIDPARIGITGFSRWGKAAIVAGAFDERVALTIPSSSGQGGIGNYRSTNQTGVSGVQTLPQIIGEAPQWFGDNFDDANAFRTNTNTGNTAPDARVNFLPIDAHETVALVAPRAIIITEGTTDSWNYPRGPALTAQAGRIVYNYLGITNFIGFKSTNSGHTLSAGQQDAVLAYADRFLLGRNVATDTLFNNPYGAPSATLVPWTMP